MGSYNKVILCGHLGRDIELRYTQGGSAVATLSLATSESWSDRDSGERKERTEWHRIVLWGKQAESLQQYLTKGKQIIVDGQLTTREWEDKDGNKRYTTEVKAQRVTLLGGGGRRQAGDDQRREDVESADSGTQAAPSADDSDIPF